MKFPPNTTVAVAMAALTASGCSFLFSEGPPADSARRPYFTCAESYAPPIVDTVIAGLTALAVAGAKQTPDETEQAYEQRVGGTLGVAVVTGLAAIYGYAVVGSCRDAKEQHAAEAWRASRLPPPYGVGPEGAPRPVWPPPPPTLTPPGSKDVPDAGLQVRPDPAFPLQRHDPIGTAN
jgi:hypothetical protein